MFGYLVSCSFSFLTAFPKHIPNTLAIHPPILTPASDHNLLSPMAGRW